jgi:hypothetical protein
MDLLEGSIRAVSSLAPKVERVLALGKRVVADSPNGGAE